MANVKIGDLSIEISQAIKEYTEEVSSAIETEVGKTAKEITKAIIARSPKDKGDYAKGWTQKKNTSGGRVTYTIYNKNKGSIAHLLEFGHVKRGGGRVSGKPHIRPSYDQAVPEMERRIARIIQNGG